MDDRRREQKRDSANRINAAGREIGPPPPQCESEDRRRCDESLQVFLEHCFPKAFFLGWSPDHIRVLESVEKTIIQGDLKAIAMPRGCGKTSIIVRAAIWAILTGRRKFVCVVAATERAAKKLLKGIKTELLHNEMLGELYARELHAVRSLGGEPKKAAQQTCDGVLTSVEWLAEQVAFGCVDGVLTSGAAISTCGITGSIRGQQYVLNDGTILRPDTVLFDDPQTNESAKSKSQCDERHEIMMGDALGMAGPNTTIAGFATCTVIVEDDLADRLLDREKSPDWHGDKCKLVYQWPKNEVAWDEYRSVREAEMREGGDGSRANEFVKKHYDLLHDGAVVGWEHRKTDREVSALQYAYNLRFRDEGTFFAEYQNSPLSSVTEIPFHLRVEDIVSRTIDVERNVIPAECDKIVAQVDVQKNVLFFVVTAWTLDGRCHVIDYGTWPDQKRMSFKKREIRNTLQEATSATGLNEAIYAGLESLTDLLLGRTYSRVDGAEMSIDRLGVDARWGFSTRVVRRFARETKYTGKVIPTFGQYVGVNSKPWHKWKMTAGEKGGIHCRIQPPPKNTKGVRELLIDTNWWKSFAAERLLAGKGANQSIVLFKAKPHAHRMFAEHCCCETPELKTGKIGNKMIEWDQPHGGSDNDYWDCLVANCVLASIEGVQVHVEKAAKAPRNVKTQRRRRVIPLKC